MDGNQFNLELFLKDNQPLFTIFGIFGALSIYFTTLLDKNTDYPFLNLGIVSALTLFLIVSFIILKKAFQQDKKKMVIEFLTTDDENIYRLAFVIPFFLLSVTVMSFIYVRFEQEMFAIGAIFSYYIGVITYTPIIKRYVTNQKILFLISIIVIVILAIVTLHLEMKIDTFPSSTLLTIGFLKGIGLPAAMCVLAIPITYIYRKVSGKLRP